MATTASKTSVNISIQKQTVKLNFPYRVISHPPSPPQFPHQSFPPKLLLIFAPALDSTSPPHLPLPAGPAIPEEAADKRNLLPLDTGLEAHKDASPPLTQFLDPLPPVKTRIY